MHVTIIDTTSPQKRQETLPSCMEKMKICVLMVTSMIAASLAGPFKEAKLERVLEDLEVVLQDLKEGSPSAKKGGTHNTNELEALLDGVGTKPSIEMSDVQEPDNTFTPAMEDMLLHTLDIEKATAEIKAAGGRVNIQLGRDLLIAQIPSNFVAKRNILASASAHISSSASPETLRNAKAYWKYRQDKLKPQPPVQKWTEKSAPEALQRSESALFTIPSTHGKTMMGKIVIGVLIASGPGNLSISESEEENILSEIIAGFVFWITKSPPSADLSFTMNPNKVSITAPDSVTCSRNNYAACHTVFADPVLESLGYGTGQAAIDKLIQSYFSTNIFSDAYLAFFSKYKQSHFAYAYTGGGPIYMQYQNDGWGPNQIDRVFAHETGHVFNAPDEYVKCNCMEDYGKGSCSDHNTNCKDCVDPQAPCIMDKNDLNNICPHTRKHVGWCD